MVATAASSKHVDKGVHAGGTEAIAIPAPQHIRKGRLVCHSCNHSILHCVGQQAGRQSYFLYITGRQCRGYIHISPAAQKGSRESSFTAATAAGRIYNLISAAVLRP